ncbi:folate-binding protein [Alteromonas aestuariivivens]|uniref:Folate-binding protein n=1 Tax=Alteromonas aestuariivivens TaxID=1938339 RepID=A0A3D8MEM7_9ALTE|nr:folate-binding protein YgfZ [Alteromonas aestuariivivens]RDV29329.1 folate-binding protein [Alteromonas aestuariivivens]
MPLPAGLDRLPDNLVIELDHYGVIKLEGEQQDEFLHGQLTINIKALPDNQARRAAHCDFKGKTWSLSVACRHEGALLLSINGDALPHSLAQFKKYGVFSRVEITDESTHWAQYCVSGPLASEFIKNSFGSLPQTPLALVQGALGLAVKLEMADSHWLLLLNPDGKKAFDEYCLVNSLELFPSEVFEALSIQAGIPLVSGPNINEFVPQMMNVQALNGIDFNKGCYMGQEVVARTRYLGKNKRAARIFRLSQATNISPGDMVEMQLGENWRRAGTVIRSAELGAESWLLAVLPLEAEETTCFRLAQLPDVTLEKVALPYSIDEPKAPKSAGS